MPIFYKFSKPYSSLLWPSLLAGVVAFAIACGGKGASHAPSNDICGDATASPFRVKAFPNPIAYSEDGRCLYIPDRGSSTYSLSIGGPQTRMASFGGQAYTWGQAVNKKGNIVGIAFEDYHLAPITPLYWALPTSQPVAMPLPAGVTSMTPFWISGSLQILAYSSAGSDPTGHPDAMYFYSSPTAVPVKIAGPNVGGEILDDGTIVVTSSDHVSIYKGVGSAPSILKDRYGETSRVGAARISPDGTIAGADSKGAACYWRPSDYATSIDLKVPAGTVQSFASGINDSNQLCGQFKIGTAYHACFWPTVTSDPVDLREISGCDTAMAQAFNVFNDGSIFTRQDQSLPRDINYFYIVPKNKTSATAH